jgi:hypothetical protein
VQQFISYLHRTGTSFNVCLPSTFTFLVLHKGALNRSVLSFEDLLAYTSSWFHVGCYKFFIHLRSLNVCHFGMAEATALSISHRSHFQQHGLTTKFHETLLIGSEGGGHIDRQTAWWSCKLHHHHHHHHWLDSPTWALAFLRSFCQLKLSGYCFFRFRDKSLFQGWSCQPHSQPATIMEGRCFLSGLSPLTDYFQF